MNYLTVDDVLAVASQLMKTDRPLDLIRDVGLIQSAVARPATQVFGTEPYPDLPAKAAALLHSLVSNHPFINGNTRIGWLSAALFCRMNGHDLHAPTVDEGETLILGMAAGEFEEVPAIAHMLAAWTRPPT